MTVYDSQGRPFPLSTRPAARGWLAKSKGSAAGKLKTVKLVALLDRRDRLSGIHRIIGRAVAKLLGRDKAHLPEIVRIIFDHEGAPGLLLVSGTSVSRTGQVTGVRWFQESRAHHNGIYPVPNGSLGEAFVTLFNLGDAPANVVAQFNWHKGETYALPPITIAPGRTYRLDFAELVERAEPDILKRVIDPTYQKGFFSWSTRAGSRKLLGWTEVKPVDGGRLGFVGSGCCVEYPFGRIEPRKSIFVVGSTMSVVASEYRETCSAGLLGPLYALSPSLTVSPPFIWDGLTLVYCPIIRLTNKVMGRMPCLMARPVSILDITETERTELQRRLNSPTTAQRDSLRAAIVLRRGEASPNSRWPNNSASARPA